jgi:hypothetical protein
MAYSQPLTANRSVSIVNSMAYNAKRSQTVVSKTDNTKQQTEMPLKQLKLKFPQFYHYYVYGVAGLASQKQTKQPTKRAIKR